MAEDFDVLDEVDVSTGSVSVTQEYQYDDIPVDFNGVLFNVFLYDRYHIIEKRNTHLKNLSQNRWVKMTPMMTFPPISLEEYMGRVFKEYKSGNNYDGFDEPYDARQNRNYSNAEVESCITVVGEKIMVSYPDDTTAYKEFSIYIPVVRWKILESWKEFIKTFDPREYAGRQVRRVDEGEMKVGSMFFSRKDIVFPHSGHYFNRRVGMEVCVVGTSPEEDRIEPIVANYETLLDRMKKISEEYRKFEYDVRTGRYFRNFSV